MPSWARRLTISSGTPLKHCFNAEPGHGWMLENAVKMRGSLKWKHRRQLAPELYAGFVLKYCSNRMSEWMSPNLKVIMCISICISMNAMSRGRQRTEWAWVELFMTRGFSLTPSRLFEPSYHDYFRKGKTLNVPQSASFTHPAVQLEHPANTCVATRK